MLVAWMDLLGSAVTAMPSPWSAELHNFDGAAANAPQKHSQLLSMCMLDESSYIVVMVLPHSQCVSDASQ